MKCALLLRSMAQTLNMGNKDVEMTNALRLFGYEVVNLLYPDREPVGDAIVEKPGKWNFAPRQPIGQQQRPRIILSVGLCAPTSPNRSWPATTGQ